MAEGPDFGAFVRPVKGHCVPRYGTTEYLGASRGPDGFEWDESRIIPLTADYCRQYPRELAQHIAEGSLVACKRDEHTKQEAARAKAASKPQTSEGTTNEEPRK
jgi:hypothetical protein